MNILVMQFYRYGDLLQTTPALAVLRRRNPNARICVMARKPYDEVLHGNPDVDEVVAWDSDLLGGAGDAEAFLRRCYSHRSHIMPLRSRRFDAIYNFSGDLPSALLTHMLRPRTAVGLVFCTDRRYRVRNEWMRYLFVSTDVRWLNSINLSDIFIGACGGGHVASPVFAVRPQDDRAAEELLAREFGGVPPGLVGIQVGASKDYKRWPIRSFAELAQRLIAHGHSLLFFGSREERELAASAMPKDASPRARALNLAGKTSFSALAAFIKRCRLLISNDTAAVHVAAAVSTPCLVLTFGPTSGWDTGPYGEGHFILEPRMDCFPCKWSAHCRDLACRDLLSVDSVFTAAAYALDPSGEMPRFSGTHAPVLLRSTRMPDGLMGLRPLTRPTLTLRDLLRLILRRYYLMRCLPGAAETSQGELQPWEDEALSWYARPDPAELASQLLSATEDLAALEKMASLGVQAARVAMGEVPTQSSAACARLAESVARLEKRIIAAEENETLKFLVASFRHALLDMDILPAREKAALHRANYARLAEGCAFVRQALRDFAVQAGLNVTPTATRSDETIRHVLALTGSDHAIP